MVQSLWSNQQSNIVRLPAASGQDEGVERDFVILEFGSCTCKQKAEGRPNCLPPNSTPHTIKGSGPLGVLGISEFRFCCGAFFCQYHLPQVHCGDVAFLFARQSSGETTGPSWFFGSGLRVFIGQGSEQPETLNPKPLESRLC